MNAPDLLAEFAQRIRLPALSFSPEGTARLVVDGALEIDLEHDDARGQLHLSASLGQAPLENREDFYARALAANLFGLRTGGATLALDPVHAELLLVRTLTLETTDITAFETALQDLVDTRERLGAELVGTARESGAAAAPVADFERSLMMRA